jgi:hypothetical protein
MSFNDVMRTFLTDLSDVFPEDAAIQSSLESFEDIVRVNFKKPAQMFVESIGPHAARIVKRDESVFDSMHFPGFDFRPLWDSDISNNTKLAIWAYLEQLLVLSVKNQ